MVDGGGLSGKQILSSSWKEGAGLNTIQKSIWVIHFEDMICDAKQSHGARWATGEHVHLAEMEFELG